MYEQRSNIVELSKQDPFVKTPVLVLIDDRLTCGQKLLYLTLEIYMHRRSRTCFPSVGTLVRASGLSKSSVFRGLKRLESLGLVERRQNKGRSNVYHLVPTETAYRESGDNWHQIRADVRASIGRRGLGRILQMEEKCLTKRAVPKNDTRRSS